MHTYFRIPGVGEDMFDRLFRKKTDPLDTICQLLADRRYPEADEEVKKFMASRPKDAKGMLQIGQLYVEHRRFQSAIDPLGRAVQLNPGLYQAHNMLAVIFLEDRWYQNAEDHLKTSLTINPDLPQTHHLLGKVYAGRKLWDSALLEYGKALALAPGTREFQESIAEVEQQRSSLDRSNAQLIERMQRDRSLLDLSDDQLIERVQRDRSLLPELSKRKNEKTFEALKEFISINEHDYETRARAMAALLEFRDFPVNAALREYIDDNFGSYLSSYDGHGVMEIAVRNLRIADDPDALATLFRFSGAPEYAECSKLALQKIVDLGPGALPGLFPYLESRSFHERFYAVKIITQIGDASAITPLEELYRREEGWAIRNLIIKYLIRSPDPGVQDFLREALSTETDEGIRGQITEKIREAQGDIQAISGHFEKAQNRGELFQMFQRFPIAEFENFLRFYPLEELRLDFQGALFDNRFEKFDVLVQILCDYPELTREDPATFPPAIPSQKFLDILVQRLIPFVKSQRKDQIAAGVQLWMVDMGVFLMKVERERDALVFLEQAYPSARMDHSFAIAAAYSNLALSGKDPRDIGMAREKLNEIISGRARSRDDLIGQARDLLRSLDKI